MWLLPLLQKEVLQDLHRLKAKAATVWLFLAGVWYRSRCTEQGIACLLHWEQIVDPFPPDHPPIEVGTLLPEHGQPCTRSRGHLPGIPPWCRLQRSPEVDWGKSWSFFYCIWQPWVQVSLIPSGCSRSFYCFQCVHNIDIWGICLTCVFCIV